MVLKKIIVLALLEIFVVEAVTTTSSELKSWRDRLACGSGLSDFVWKGTSHSNYRCEREKLSIKYPITSHPMATTQCGHQLGKSILVGIGSLPVPLFCEAQRWITLDSWSWVQSCEICFKCSHISAVQGGWARRCRRTHPFYNMWWHCTHVPGE